jgi:hypothetical protein
MNNYFNFTSLVTSDYVNDFHEKQQKIFLYMLNTVDPNSYITLYYFQSQSYVLNKENGEKTNVFQFNNLEPQRYSFIFHKNENDIVDLYSKDNLVDDIDSNPIFISVNSHNFLKILKHFQSVNNNIFLTFKVQELISIFSHSNKSLNEFAQIHLDKMTDEPIKFLLPNILSNEECPWKSFDFNNKTIQSFNDYVFTSNNLGDQFNSFILFNKFHKPIYYSINKNLRLGFVPICNFFDSSKSFYYDSKINRSFFDFIKNNTDLLSYQNEIFVDTIKKYPHVTLEIFKTNKINIVEKNKSIIDKFPHLKNLNVNVIDFIPVYINEKNTFNIFLNIHDHFNSFFNSNIKYEIFHCFDLRTSHIQNTNNLGSELLKNTFFNIYNHNPQYVFSMLKAMSVVHDNHFLKDIITTLFNDIKNFSTNTQFINELEVIKTEYYPYIFKTFKTIEPIKINLDNKSLDINIRSLLSYIDDNRYEHALNLINFYFHTIKKTSTYFSESEIFTTNIDDFIFNGNIHTTSKININFSKCSIFDSLEPHQMLNIFQKILNDFSEFMYNQADKSSHYSLSVSPELREQILNLTIFVKDIIIDSVHTKRIKHKI